MHECECMGYKILSSVEMLYKSEVVKHHVLFNERGVVASFTEDSTGEYAGLLQYIEHTESEDVVVLKEFHDCIEAYHVFKEAEFKIWSGKVVGKYPEKLISAYILPLYITSMDAALEVSAQVNKSLGFSSTSKEGDMLRALYLVLYGIVTTRNILLSEESITVDAGITSMQKVDPQILYSFSRYSINYLQNLQNILGYLMSNIVKATSKTEFCNKFKQVKFTRYPPKKLWKLGVKFSTALFNSNQINLKTE